MLLTILLSFVLIVSVCLLLYAAVALIQDRRFFTTEPKDIQAAAIEHPERFPGAHALGWVLAIISLLAMMSARWSVPITEALFSILQKSRKSNCLSQDCFRADLRNGA